MDLNEYTVFNGQMQHCERKNVDIKNEYTWNKNCILSLVERVKKKKQAYL